MIIVSNLRVFVLMHQSFDIKNQYPANSINVQTQPLNPQNKMHGTVEKNVNEGTIILETA